MKKKAQLTSVLEMRRWMVLSVTNGSALRRRMNPGSAFVLVFCRYRCLGGGGGDAFNWNFTCHSRVAIIKKEEFVGEEEAEKER